MPKPLALLIRPPYGSWQLEFQYGDDTGNDGKRTHTCLSTTGDGQLHAAASGALSTRMPGNLSPPSVNEITPPSIGDPLPDAISLFLLLDPFILITNPLFRLRARQINNIRGFAYLNVDTASLEASLAELLDSSTVPPGILTRRQVIHLFLRGNLDIPVTAGHAIAQAAAGVGTSREVGFTVLTDIGPIDPSHYYDWMRDYVEDGQAALDEFLLKVPKRWPLIASSLNDQAAIDLTKASSYSWPVLEELRSSRQLNHSQWREVGNNQKSIWRRRMLRRVGHPPAGSIDPPFEFDDLDWKNLFQLEAIVEFYANFDDPVKKGATPTPETDPNYKRVDFLCPEGDTATLGGASDNELTLDGASDLSRIIQNYDTIYVENDLNRQSGLYKISKVNGRKVTILSTGSNDDTPILIPSGPTPWKINLRPILVLIDSFGTRLKGKKANIKTSGAQSVISLDGNPDLSQVNDDSDTIYLPSDTYRNSRTYRIIAHSNSAGDKTVTVSGKPNLSGGDSVWQIPGGLSGEHPNPLAYNFVSALGQEIAHQGIDHYDGVLFLVHDNSIVQCFRFSSYTSRKHSAATENSSSIRGNREYFFTSYRSSDEGKNYSLKVVDREISAGDQYDGVRDARKYFQSKVERDFANPDPTSQDYIPDNSVGKPKGKKWIRVHNGRDGTANNSNNPNLGTGSAGCIVSPIYFRLRTELITIYNDEFKALNGGIEDGEVKKLQGKTRQQAQQVYNGVLDGGLTEANWKDRIVGKLWIIRPDERPIGQVSDEEWK